MKATIHKLLAGASLGALAIFGMTVLSSDSSNDNSSVWAFLNDSCSSELSMIFLSLDDMIRYDGTTDQWGFTWDFKSYYKATELYDQILKCYKWDGKVDPEVKTKRIRPKTPITPDPPPQSQEPPPPANSGAEFDEDKADKLKKCWEKKATELSSKKQKTFEGFTPSELVQTSKGSGAVWEIVWGDDRGIAVTEHKVIKKEGEDPNLAINVALLPDGIYKKIREGGAQYNFDFNHLATYGQMQESYHVAQLVKIFNATKSEPKPYQYWELEVDSHVWANKLWLAIYGKSAGPPSIIRDDNKGMSKAYKTKMKEYKDLEEQLKKKGLTDKKKKEIEADMKALETWLEDPANLPKAEANLGYKRDEVDLDCDLEKEKD